MSFHVHKDLKIITAFNQWPLEMNQNESDTWLWHIEQTFVREKEETKSLNEPDFVVKKKNEFYSPLLVRRQEK